jgi:DNA-binding response OmpR family regulator
VAIVERYEGVRRTCARYLDHYNFHVDEAASAEDGLSVLRASHPAVILIEDDPSPHFEELRRTAVSMAVPIVSLTTALSGDASPPAANAAIASVLQKPFSLVAMLDEIRRLVRSPEPGARQAPRDDAPV